jgi:hypothetical protein
MERYPSKEWEFANPPKKLKPITEISDARSLPKPETKEDRLENIYNATSRPIYIPRIEAQDVEMGNCPVQEETHKPNTFRRSGGLDRPEGEESE